MDKIKTVKIKNPDGSVSEETYTISVDAKDVDMANGKELQETIGTIDIDTDGNIAEQLENLNNNVNDLNIDIKKKAYFFDTVADMKNANLKVGDYACTLGYYEANDGGAGSYNVITAENHTDNGGTYHKLNNNLFAKLIINNDTVNVKQFGAYGDGVHDDTVAIKRAIQTSYKTICFSPDTYRLTDELDLPNHIYNGLGATILVYSLTASPRETMIRNTYYFYPSGANNYNNIEIYNFNFNCERKRNAYLLGLQNCTVKIMNCSFVAAGGGLLDLYGNNSNSIVKNCSFILNNNKTTLGTCFHIRGFGWGATENVLIESCYFQQDTRDDETIWINAGSCPISNVTISNCIMKDIGSSNNMIWVGNTATYIKDIIFSNNQIYKSALSNRCITLGTTESSDLNKASHDNILFTNNLITVEKTTASNVSYVITYSQWNNVNVPQKKCVISNNIINCLGTSQMSSVIEGYCICKNNQIKIANARNCYFHGAEADGDIITGTCNSLIQWCANGTYSNLNVNITGNLIGDSIYASSGMIIKNSKINCRYILEVGSTTQNGSYRFINNVITGSQNYLIGNWNEGTGTISVYLENNDIISTWWYVLGQPLQLYLGINYKGGVLTKGIPETALDRESCPIGTIQPSKTNGKIIVRKISTGNETSNWEEI